MKSEKQAEISISRDKMSAFLTLPEDGLWDLTSVKQFLRTKGVIFGVSDAAINTCISICRGEPCQIAWGLKPHFESVRKNTPRPRIVYTFNHSRGRPPNTLTVGPQFKVQWRELQSRGSVRKGSTLAFVRNPETCTLGITVTGEKVPYFAQNPVLSCGSNAQLSEDGKRALALRQGIPYVENRIPGVLSFITLIGDIGPETGDITFPGDLEIRGNVSQGFKVSAWGAVSILGNLYGSLSCAGDIVVKGGINAPGEKVESGGAISAKYCENSMIRALGNVAIEDAVMHSTVETEQMLAVNENIGRIVGGVTVARLGVRAHSVGSPMGIPTLFQIGASPKSRKRYERFQKEIALIEAEIKKIKHTGLHPVSGKDVQLENLRLQRMVKRLEGRLKELEEALQSVKETIIQSRQGSFVSKMVLPGTKVMLGLNESTFNVPKQTVVIGVKTDETD